MGAVTVTSQPMEVDAEIHRPDEDIPHEDLMQESQTDISDLPLELVFAIFDYLGVADKGRAAQVCCSWRDTINDPFLWRNAELVLDLDDISATVLGSLRERKIKRVVVARGQRLENLGELLCYLPTLESLKVNKLGPLEVDLTKKLFCRSLPRLRELHIRCHDSDQHEKLFDHLNCLKILRICDDPRAFPSIVLSLKKLEVLKFDSMPFPGGFYLDLQVLHSSAMESLTQLCIEYFRIGDRDIRFVKEGLPNLRTICFTLSRTATEHSMQILGEMPNLEKVRIRCDLLTDIMLKHIAQELSNINVLHLLPCVSAHRTKTVYSQMPNIEELLFQFPSDATLKFISTGFRNLQKLKLQYTGHITHSGINYIARLSHLVHLTLDCSQINDEQLQQICRSLQRLQSLALVFCPSISHIGMNAVAGMANLKDLSLFYCKVSDADIKCLCRDCIPLANFRVWDCPISNVALKDLSRFCRVSRSFQQHEENRCFV